VIDIGAVFITSGDKLAGIFTERDYLHKIILQGKSSKTTIVKEVMTKVFNPILVLIYRMLYQFLPRPQ
jgi:CBS domain-containing protein